MMRLRNNCCKLISVEANLIFITFISCKPTLQGKFYRLKISRTHNNKVIAKPQMSCYRVIRFLVQQQSCLFPIQRTQFQQIFSYSHRTWIKLKSWLVTLGLYSRMGYLQILTAIIGMLHTHITIIM